MTTNECIRHSLKLFVVSLPNEGVDDVQIQYAPDKVINVLSMFKPRLLVNLILVRYLVLSHLLHLIICQLDHLLPRVLEKGIIVDIST